MDVFGRDTIEFENNKKLEKIEWDDLWFNDANDETVKRILFLGASMIRGFRPYVNELLYNDNRVADQLATSKSVDNPYFFNLIDYAISQQPKIDIIYIVFGGHGSHLNISEYEKYYREMIKYLMENYSDKKLVISNLVPFRNKDNFAELSSHNQFYVDRGGVAKKVAEEFSIPFVDLYSAFINRNDYNETYAHDGIHLTSKGNKIIANEIYSALKKFI